MELGDGQYLFMVDGIGSVCGGTRHRVEYLDYAVGGIHGRLGDIVTRGDHKGNTKFSLVELWTILMCAVSY